VKIDRAYYQRVFNMGDYENELIGLEGELSAGEDWAAGMEDLKNKVQLLGLEYAKDRNADHDASYREYGAKARLERINADIAAAEAKWKTALAFLEKMGVDFSDVVAQDDIPF